mmetsp:Transcript_40953/g.118311  ORF Transcript_40953/g.118311 Transcript_40953/m.118311 type:complete len:302 (+) Transcript_40953:943-1848(+)
MATFAKVRGQARTHGGAVPGQGRPRPRGGGGAAGAPELGLQLQALRAKAPRLADADGLAPVASHLLCGSLASDQQRVLLVLQLLRQLCGLLPRSVQSLLCALAAPLLAVQLGLEALKRVQLVRQARLRSGGRTDGVHSGEVAGTLELKLRPQLRGSLGVAGYGSLRLAPQLLRPRLRLHQPLRPRLQLMLCCKVFTAEVQLRGRGALPLLAQLRGLGVARGQLLLQGPQSVRGLRAPRLQLLLLLLPHAPALQRGRPRLALVPVQGAGREGRLRGAAPPLLPLRDRPPHAGLWPAGLPVGL